MTDSRIVLLLLVSAVLIGVVGVEIVDGTGAVSSTIAAQPRRDQIAAVPRLPSAPSPDIIASSLARPLFSSTRRPPESAQNSAATPELSDKRLAGIVVEPDRRFAIFAVSGAKPLTVSEGDDVGGFRVETINAREVSVRGPNGTRTLQPKLDLNLSPPVHKPSAEPAPQTPTRSFPSPAQNTSGIPPNLNVGAGSRRNRE